MRHIETIPNFSKVGFFMLPSQAELSEHIFIKLSITLPLIFARKDIPKYLGSSISIGTLANAASGGYGPPCIRKGRNAIYEKESFLAWLKVYLEGGLKKVKAVYYQRE